jgi:hypothetical protein
MSNTEKGCYLLSVANKDERRLLLGREHENLCAERDGWVLTGVYR